MGARADTGGVGLGNATLEPVGERSGVNQRIPAVTAKLNDAPEPLMVYEMRQ